MLLSKATWSKNSTWTVEFGYRWARCKDPEMEVTGLTPGHEYQFRVKACNKEGESEPLETLGSVKAKDPFCKFVFSDSARVQVPWVKLVFYFYSRTHSTGSTRTGRLEREPSRSHMERARFRRRDSDRRIHHRKEGQVQHDLGKSSGNKYGHSSGSGSRSDRRQRVSVPRDSS